MSKVNLKQWPKGLKKKSSLIPGSGFKKKGVTVGFRMSVTWQVWSSLAD